MNSILRMQIPTPNESKRKTTFRRVAWTMFFSTRNSLGFVRSKEQMFLRKSSSIGKTSGIVCQRKSPSTRCFSSDGTVDDRLALMLLLLPMAEEKSPCDDSNRNRRTNGQFVADDVFHFSEEFACSSTRPPHPPIRLCHRRRSWKLEWKGRMAVDRSTKDSDRRSTWDLCRRGKGHVTEETSFLRFASKSASSPMLFIDLESDRLAVGSIAHLLHRPDPMLLFRAEPRTFFFVGLRNGHEPKQDSRFSFPPSVRSCSDLRAVTRPVKSLSLSLSIREQQRRFRHRSAIFAPRRDEKSFPSSSLLVLSLSKDGKSAPPTLKEIEGDGLSRQGNFPLDKTQKEFLRFNIDQRQIDKREELEKDREMCTVFPDRSSISSRRRR